MRMAAELSTSSGWMSPMISWLNLTGITIFRMAMRRMMAEAGTMANRSFMTH